MEDPMERCERSFVFLLADDDDDQFLIIVMINLTTLGMFWSK